MRSPNADSAGEGPAMGNGGAGGSARTTLRHVATAQSRSASSRHTTVQRASLFSEGLTVIAISTQQGSGS